MVIQVYSTAAQAIRLNLTWRANSLLLHIITYYKDYIIFNSFSYTSLPDPSCAREMVNRDPNF